MWKPCRIRMNEVQHSLYNHIGLYDHLDIFLKFIDGSDMPCVLCSIFYNNHSLYALILTFMQISRF